MVYIIIAVIVLILILKFILSKEFVIKNVDNSQLNEMFQTLLFRGSDGAFLVIKKKRNKPFVQFKKFIVKKGTVDLHFDFPKAKWSEIYFDKVKELLISKDIPYRISPVTDEDPLSFIKVNFHEDVNKCVDIVESIFTEVFKLEPEIKYVLKFSSISPHDIKVGF